MNPKPLMALLFLPTDGILLLVFSTFSLLLEALSSTETNREVLEYSFAIISKLEQVHQRVMFNGSK